MSDQNTDVGANALNAYVLPPLPSDLPLPGLLPITDPYLYRIAVTHVSVYCIPRKRHDLDLESYSKIQDYEKLEYVGDSILGSAVTLLLQELYPDMREGVATMIKSHCVCNATLAQLADRYGITDRLQASKSARYVTARQTKTKGSLFESWIAGVFYSHLRIRNINKQSIQTEDEEQDVESSGEPQELSPAAVAQEALVSEEQSGKELDPQNVEATSIASPSAVKPSGNDEEDEEEDEAQEAKEEKDDENLGLRELFPLSQPTTPPPAEPCMEDEVNTRTYGQAFDHIYAWLKPLFVPIIKFTLESMRKEQRRIELGIAEEERKVEKEIIRSLDEMSIGAKGALYTYWVNHFGKEPRYNSVRAGPGIWRTTCSVVDDEGKEWTGAADRQTKKLGCSVSSYLVCQQLRLLK